MSSFIYRNLLLSSIFRLSLVSPAAASTVSPADVGSVAELQPSSGPDFSGTSTFEPRFQLSSDSCPDETWVRRDFDYSIY